MEGFCRGCLIRYDDPMELLQYTEKYRRLFVYSTGLQVKRADTITFQLCKDCFLNMKAACKFKKLCRSADKRLKSYLALKDVGDGIDFCTFLKNNDDTMAFRLPLMSGSSTPATQKPRDEDNESTCTSIRNFMTDILQGEEMPDTEARIIREVIEEEADVLDDSLDSHWLQDDASIDTDFRLDFSFSPFGTPRSVSNDQYYTPKRQASEQEQPKKYFTSISPFRNYNVNDFTDFIKNDQSEKELCVFGTDTIREEELVDNVDISSQKEKILNNLKIPIETENDKSITNSDIPNIDSDKLVNNLNLPIINDEIDSEKSINNLDLPSFDSEKSMMSLDLPSLSSIENDESLNNLDLPIIGNEEKNEIVNMKSFYMPSDGSNYITTSNELERIVDSKVNVKKKKVCVIDKNLERALEDEDNKEFSLEDLLGTPRGLSTPSAGSTPAIANILFGEKLDLDAINTNKKKIKYHNDIGELIDELIQNNTMEFYSEIKTKEDLIHKDVDEVDTGKKEIIITDNISIDNKKQFDLENFICNLCNKKFKNCKALLIHFNKKHHVKIIKPKKNDSKLHLCNICGVKLKDRKIFHKHMKRYHNKPKPEMFKCDLCSCEFSSKPKIEIHMIGHFGKPAKQNLGKFLCTICGASSTTVSNFRIHQKRHASNGDNYTHKCKDCGKGFIWPSDLTVHMRKHTGERPFKCEFCDCIFARKDYLTRHAKIHIDNKPFKCKYCLMKFTNSSLLKLHMKDAKKCLKKQKLANPAYRFIQTVELAGDEIEVKYEVGDEIQVKLEPYIDEMPCIELPYIDTEMSN